MGPHEQHQTLWPCWAHPARYRAQREETRGEQKKRWEDNVAEWTPFKLSEAMRPAEDREGWRDLLGRSAVVPQRPTGVTGRTGLSTELVGWLVGWKLKCLSFQARNEKTVASTSAE